MAHRVVTAAQRIGYLTTAIDSLQTAAGRLRKRSAYDVGLVLSQTIRDLNAIRSRQVERALRAGVSGDELVKVGGCPPSLVQGMADDLAKAAGVEPTDEELRSLHFRPSEWHERQGLDKATDAIHRPHGS